MEKTTFIMLDRNILKWRWYQNPNTMRLFIHLILKANIKDTDFENITVHRGEFVTSYASLSKELGMTVKEVRTALEHLKWTGEAASKKYAKFQVISILSYDKYQTATADLTADLTAGNGQATGRQAAGNGQQSNNGNKDNNIINNIYIVEIVDYLNKKVGSKFKPTAKNTVSHINARLKEGYTVEQFKQVIDKKCADWLNDTKMCEYLRPETLFGTKFESYLNSATVNRVIDKTDPNSYSGEDDSEEFLKRYG